jgi:ATP-dependent DNA ligase
MENYQKLYKLKANNKYYCWTIKIIEKDNKHFIQTSHGQVDGKQVIHEREVKAKSNRSIIEQCNLEASKKWNDKKNKEGYTENMEEENQNIITLIRPMLAQPFDISKYQGKRKCKKINFPCYGQPKYDGIRCLMSFGTDSVKMESRKGTQFLNFEILREEFREKFINYTDYVFDGELYSYDYPFEKINGLVRLKKPSENQIYEINQLKFVIYDVINKNNLNMTFQERNDLLYNISQQDFINIEFCNTVNINSLEEIDEIHDQFVQDGFEGLILRNIDGTYEINKRSYDLQKYKKTMDEEFTIIDYFEGKGVEKGLILFKCITDNNLEFNVRPRGSHDYRRELFQNGDSLIGQKLTVIFQEYSADGIPRFPVGKAIRHDK